MRKMFSLIGELQESNKLLLTTTAALKFIPTIPKLANSISVNDQEGRNKRSLIDDDYYHDQMNPAKRSLSIPILSTMSSPAVQVGCYELPYGRVTITQIYISTC